MTDSATDSSRTKSLEFMVWTSISKLFWYGLEDSINRSGWVGYHQHTDVITEHLLLIFIIANEALLQNLHGYHKPFVYPEISLWFSYYRMTNNADTKKFIDLFDCLFCCLS